MLAQEQKISIQERRLSSLMDIIKLPKIKPRRVSGGSYQIDSSSWEFLNKDHDAREGGIGSEDSVSSSRSIQSSSSKDSVIKVNLTQHPQ